ncbi:MAG: methyltransferase domain-containing protein [Clostridia bacterium]|nr:methyltransferase domain-containing protein [Clostridia bacterium]MBQ4396002.1 methyltransferase domain-containing protein [Clostridia bacterium]
MIKNFHCHNLICPLCGEPLHQSNGSLFCPQRHTFDIARQGYVNLLPVQHKHSLVPGDTPDMLAARRAFLDEGHYAPVCRDTIDAIRQYAPSIRTLVDVGCGEGYYTARFADEFPDAVLIGADIAKAAVKMACSRDSHIDWMTATASHLPIADGCADGITAMFSLVCEEEFARVLRPGGIVVEITADTAHLIELKHIIYDDVFEQHKHPKPPQGFLREISCKQHSFRLTLDHAQLTRLLQMTPHTLRVRPERRALLDTVPSLTLTVAYFVRVLQKP